MNRSLIVLLAFLVGVPPLARGAAGDTLASFEEPHTGSDASWTFTVVNDEAHNLSAVLFLNPVHARPMELRLIAENGTVVWNRTRGHGSETLPSLDPGGYTFELHGAGTFTVTRRYLDTLPARPNVTITDVDRKLSQRTEAWIMLASRPWNVMINATGLNVDWEELTKMDVTESAEHLTTPVNHSAVQAHYYLVYLRGTPGTPYTMHLDPAPFPDAAPTVAKTPGAPLASLILGVLCAAVFARRAWRPKD